MEEVVKIVARIHKDRIKFTQEAIKSAERCLSGDLSPGQIATRFKEKVGFRLVLTESKSTKKNKKLMALRKTRS